MQKNKTTVSQQKAAAQKGGGKMPAKIAARTAYAIGFALFFGFFSFTYGDVLMRAEQESFFSFDASLMKYVFDQSNGYLYWAGRFVLLACKNAWTGALLLAAVFTLTAWLIDRTLRLPAKQCGAGFVLPAAVGGWMLWRGTNIYYKSEPSLIVLVPLGLLLLAALAAAVSRLLKGRYAFPTDASAKPFGAAVPALCVAVLIAYAHIYNSNVMLSARVQNLAQRAEWEQIIEEVRAAKRPTRTPAAYHAIALVQTGQLLEGMFDIVYDYPDARLDLIEGGEEYAMFVPDANLYAGLVNAGYRTNMDHVVMDGPRLYYLKRMVQCAILNEEHRLAEKYLDIISHNPFEGEFVEKYTALNNNPKAVEEDAELAAIRTLLPREQRFEQSYRMPAFLGYNVGLTEGSDATLITSAAACLYSKDLQAFLLRAQILAQKGFGMTKSVMQALAIMSLKDPNIEKMFNIPPYVQNEVRSFLVEAKPYVKDRYELRKNLKKNWLGSYMYYYYCENNEPDQVRPATESNHKAGVN